MSIAEKTAVAGTFPAGFDMENWGIVSAKTARAILAIAERTSDSLRNMKPLAPFDPREAAS
jgi:hypothetical protein